MTEDEVKKIVQKMVREEILSMKFAAYDGDKPKTGSRKLSEWAWAAEQGRLHAESPHEGGEHTHDVTGKAK